MIDYWITINGAYALGGRLILHQPRSVKPYIGPKDSLSLLSSYVNRVCVYVLSRNPKLEPETKSC